MSRRRCIQAKQSEKAVAQRNLRLPNYLVVFLLLGIILTPCGIVAYYCANLSTNYNIPKGSMRIGIGPKNSLTAVSTKMIFSVPYDEINLEVSFRFTEFKKYHIHIIMPYETLDAEPYVIYQHNLYYGEKLSEIGNATVNFKNFPEQKASIVNATFVPDHDFHFLPDEAVTLSIHVYVIGLVSINFPLDSKQTVILSFFGGAVAWDDTMAPYIGINNLYMDDYPFRVSVQFPRENYLASGTFPTPIELFVTESWRSAMFDLDFSYPEGYGQSISCSYSNPQNESKRHFLTFISAVVFTTGITSFFELGVELLRKRRRQKNKMGQKEKTEDKEEETRESKKTVSDVDLVKIQIYTEDLHTRLTLLLTFILGLLFTFSVAFYTFLTEGLFSILQFLVVFGFLYSMCFLYMVSYIRGYNRDFKRISEMIEMVKEGRELPRLEDLRKTCGSYEMGEEDEKKPETQSSIAEYRVLNEAIWRRGRDSLVVNSIMIPASLAIVTFAIRFRSELGTNILFNVPNAGFVPLIGLILIIIPYFLWLTSTKLDDICFDRIYKIEENLRIKGNRWVRKQVECNTWFKVRRRMWHAIFLVIMGAYIFTSFWLFRETIVS